MTCGSCVVKCNVSFKLFVFRFAYIIIIIIVICIIIIISSKCTEYAHTTSCCKAYCVGNIVNSTVN